MAELILLGKYNIRILYSSGKSNCNCNQGISDSNTITVEFVIVLIN